MIEPTRRGVLAASAAVLSGGAGLVLPLAGPAWAQAAAPTPACGHGGATLRQTEGPYFKPRSPERGDLRDAGLRGKEIELSGRVLTRSCRPVVRALVDLWHADARGDYDNAGFRLRGHVFTDAEGRYTFRTIVPGAYPGRTRHFHLKAQAPDRPVLTTQFYFPGERDNGRDPLFRRELLMDVAERGEGIAARFDIVLDLA